MRLNDKRSFDVHLTIYTEPFTRKNHECVSACHIMTCTIITVQYVIILRYTITIIPPSEMLYFSVKILYFININLSRYTRYYAQEWEIHEVLEHEMTRITKCKRKTFK